MKKLLVSLAVCLLISSSNGTCEENKECKISVNSQSIFSNGLKDLDFINQLVKTKYAPFSWKEKIFGWNAEKELQNFRDSLSWYYLKVSHVQDSMVKYFEALRDYHAGIHFFATESSYLPLVLKRAINGNVFVVDIFSPINGLSIGDEVIEFEGSPIRNIIAYKMKGKGGLTDFSSAVRDLTFASRAGGASHIPSGCSSLLLKKSDGSLKNVVVSWRYTPEQVKDLVNIYTHVPTPYAVRSIFKHDEKKNAQLPSQSLRTDMLPFFWKFRKHWESSFREHGLGAKLGFLPYFGHSVVWEQKTGPFRAYICKAVDSNGISKNLGFIRIPTYNWDEMQDGVDAPWELFGKIVSFMQAHTDGLIIDQQNNPGGSVFYMYGLISMLIEQPVNLPLHHMTITQEEVQSSVNWLETLKNVATDYEAQEVLGDHMEGLPTDLRSARALKDFSRKIIREWEFGRYSFTNPLPLLGFDKVYPNPYYRYTKPIVMLINEECYSCGDLMPAIMKDNDRALLIGQVTAGAGGFVYQVEFPNRSGISSCSLTGSMALRKDGSCIENVGVTPDVILNFTDFDLKSGDYEDYMQNVKNLSLSWVQEHNSGRNAVDPDPNFVIQ